VKVLHVALTPVAGSPIRIVNALNAHTDVSARLVTLRPNAYGNRTFENDLIWSKNREETLDLLGSAEIIHLHQYFDLANNAFGIDFCEYQKEGIILIRQYHSVPWHGGWPMKKVLAEPIHKLVIAQYPERYYPSARVIPNLVPINHPLYTPLVRPPSRSQNVRVFFSPSTSVSAWDDRWATKGAPETIRMLKRIKKQFPDKVDLVVIKDCPHDLCMEERRSCDIVIDELVTGSFHLASLESLAQGLPTLAYLDNRILHNLRSITGCNWIPWINTHLEEAERYLIELIRNRDYRIDVGKKSREWMETFYSDTRLVDLFVDTYHALRSNPGLKFKLRFDERNPESIWAVRGEADSLWQEKFQRLGPPLCVVFMKRFCRKKKQLLRKVIEKLYKIFCRYSFLRFHNSCNTR